jgi:prepilin-type N-terminal cleavage/methylation domain-containing protein
MDFRKNNKGLTLIETVISLTLVAVLATAFAGALVVGFQSETTSNNLDKAVKMAAASLDFLGQNYERENNFSRHVLSNISFTGNSYSNDLDSFKNDINSDYFNDNIYDLYIDQFDYDNSNSEINITKINEDLKLYNLELIIAWNSGENTGQYNIESIYGGSYE